jgi:hypothetical protein
MTVNKLLIATLALLALTPAAGAATKTYDVERIHIQISGDIAGRGWLFMEDVKGVRSSLQLVLLDGEGTIVYGCHVFRTGRDFNIVNVGPFAQQATAATSTAFMGRGSAAPCGTKVTSVTVSCPFAGIPAPESLNQVTINQSGTYRGAEGTASSYKITGRRDVPALCTINVTTQTVSPGTIETEVETFEGVATLTRLSSAHTGDTSFVDFWRDPFGWLDLRDVTFPF